VIQKYFLTPWSLKHGEVWEVRRELKDEKKQKHIPESAAAGILTVVTVLVTHWLRFHNHSRYGGGLALPGFLRVFGGHYNGAKVFCQFLNCVLVG
jgi:hypothetical protein